MSLSLPTNVDATSYGAKSLSQVRKDHFLLITDRGYEKVTPSKLEERDKKMFLLFEELSPGKLPEFTHPLEELRWLLQILQAKEQDPGLSPLWVKDILIPTDRGVLIPSRTYTDTLLNNEKIRFTRMEPYNHPDLTSPQSLSYNMGVLAIEVLTGELPFKGNNPEDLRDRIRETKLAPMELQLPRLNPRVGALIDASLKNDPPGLYQWQLLLESLEEEPLYRELPSEEEEVLKEKGKQIKMKVEKGWERKVFFRKYKFHLAAAAIVLAVIASIAGTYIQAALEPPLTEGFTPREVVEAYYQSVSELDTLLFADTLVKEEVSDLDTLVQNLYVTTKTQFAYEGRDHLYDAQTWVDQGRQNKPLDESLFGVAQLEITPLGEGVFQAEYELWMPASSDEEQGYLSEGYYKTDILTLEQDKKGNWVIIKIDPAYGDAIKN